MNDGGHNARVLKKWEKLLEPFSIVVVTVVADKTAPACPLVHRSKTARPLRKSSLGYRASASKANASAKATIYPCSPWRSVVYGIQISEDREV